MQPLSGGRSGPIGSTSTGCSGTSGAPAGTRPRRYEQLVEERKEAREAELAAARASASSDWDDGSGSAQFATPAGDWERIHSRSVSSPTRAYTPGLFGRAQPSP
jgi:hypothetical protein